MDGRWEKVGVFSDIHGSHNVEKTVLEHALETHPDITSYILNGDSKNNDEASPFPGSYSSVSAAEEHNATLGFFGEWFDRIRQKAAEYKITPRFVFNVGNHERRVERGSQKFSTEPSKLFTGWVDNLSILAGGYSMERFEDPVMGALWVPKQKYHWDDVYYMPGLNAHVTRVGSNCLVLHAQKSYKLSSTMARLWLFDNILTRVPWARIVVQGHTHRSCDHRYGAYRYIESGCCCKPQSYADTMSRSGYPPITQGYVVLYRDRETNLVDINRIDRYQLGTPTLFNPPPAPFSEGPNENPREPHSFRIGF